ncbi:putative Methionine synthase [uncultured spirochete]|uniref:Methionine synthase n=1 Tax=uncultured spirochete TaxID=156406 RepID=A0A3P3XRP5_9SPIR|nr:putative Methionine synthase [uncultured spirochete]
MSPRELSGIAISGATDSLAAGQVSNPAVQGARPDEAKLRSLIGGRLILADGSTGTALEALASDAASGGRIPLLPLERPDVVETLHEAYFRAGCDLVETATFSASARDLARFASKDEGGAEGLSEAVNKAAAAAARRAADKASAIDKRIRLVAGSIGPGDAPPSLGTSTYGELFLSYLPQAKGLTEGGADLAIVETCQDPLQIKAVIAALRSQQGGRGLPFIVSATVDARGRMLAGTDIAAFVAIVSPFRPLALGLNCSGGPDELEEPLKELASLSPFPVCFMPNAGLPCTEDGCVSYPFGPELFAEKVESLARRFGVAIVGGCCGSGPGHMAALSARLSDRPNVPKRPPLRPALASLSEAKFIGPGLFRIGERANSAGSAAFAALLDAEDFEGMAEKALKQESSGAEALDLHVSRPGRDEAKDLERLVALLAPRARAALCLDSGDPEVLARVLPSVGGRPIINSASLEDPAKARRVFGLAAEFGAAVICLAMDGAGPARILEDKIRVCRRLYEMATGEFGLPPQSLLFDPLTFTVAAGGDASTTINAISAIKKACPGSLTVLGIGNVSYGLPKSARPAVTALFLDAAVRAGLDAAIMDTAGTPAPESIAPELREAAEQALGIAGRDWSIGCRRGGSHGGSRPAGDDSSRRDAVDPLGPLLAWAEARSGKNTEAGAKSPGAALLAGTKTPDSEAADPTAALSAAVLRGDTAGAEKAGQKLGETGGPEKLAAAVTAAMAESGRLWNEGTISLPLVLRSAEAARRALAPLASDAAKTAKGSIVMATVKGDLHDIGKNIVSAILACSGWRVVDLGTDVSASAIVEASHSQGALAVGLSGLLTRSLVEMKTVCEALETAGSECLVLCGGAAVDPAFVTREIEPKHPGLVRACADAFGAAAALNDFLENGARLRTPADRTSADRAHSFGPVGGGRKSTGTPILPKASPAFEPPFLGSSPPLAIPFSELLPLVDQRALFASRWNYRRGDWEEAQRHLGILLPEAERLSTPAGVYGYFRCRRAGERTVSIEVPGGRSFDLPFPVEAGGHHRTLAAHFSSAGDAIAFFAVTTGPEIARAALALQARGKLESYWRLHGLGSSLAEAAAQWMHERIARELSACGAGGRGRRYSFGFPACPGTKYQNTLLELLGAHRIGIRATTGHQLVPEHSVTAFIIARPDTVYFEA